MMGDLARLWPGVPLGVTRLAPEDLRLAPQRGRALLATWAWHERWTACPGIERDKAGCGGIVYAQLRDGVRRAACVERVTALVLDHDAGTVTPRVASELFARYRHVIHTTASHSVAAPRWRAIIAVARPMTPAEHRNVWRHVAAAVAPHIQIDRGCSDPCRLWYAPTVRALDAPWEHITHAGAPLDVDRVFATGYAAEEPRRAKVLAPLPRGAQGAYVRGALTRAARAVSEATPGERHYMLGREAFALARRELGLAPEQIRAALHPAFVAAAGERRASEGDRTIADAIHARGQRD